MPATTNKQRILNQIFSSLPKQLDVKEGSSNGKSAAPPVLEQLIYAICREGVSKTVADRAFRKLCGSFFDWNEIRVSSVREIADRLGDLPNADSRAQKITTFLQEVFELHYSFDLEGLHKKGLKVAAKQLSRYEAANEYVISSVVQRSLGGHAIPLDEPTVRVSRRLGLIEADQADPEQIQSSLQHQVPKAKGVVFSDVISLLAAEYCTEVPQCSSCPMNDICPKITDAETVTLAGDTAVASR